jgi:hypothetical protein
LTDDFPYLKILTFEFLFTKDSNLLLKNVSVIPPSERLVIYICIGLQVLGNEVESFVVGLC